MIGRRLGRVCLKHRIGGSGQHPVGGSGGQDNVVTCIKNREMLRVRGIGHELRSNRTERWLHFDILRQGRIISVT